MTANLLTGGIDEIFTRADSSGSFSPLQDALGSTIALSDSSGNVQTTYAYDPFGNTVLSGASNANEFQYTGRENEGNGLYYYRARYFSALTGRFVNQDPIGFAGGDVNLYSYVGDSPANFADRLGLSRDCFWASCGGLPGAMPQTLACRKEDAKWWSDFWHELATRDWTTGETGRELCFVTFMKATGDALNPLDFSVDNPSDWSELGTKGATTVINNVTVIYILKQGLVKPLASSAVRSLMAASETLEAASPFLAFDLAAASKGLPAEWRAAKEGACDQTF